MIENVTPIPIIAHIVGWSATTIWAMAKKYGHFNDETLRKAVETISNGRPHRFPHRKVLDFPKRVA